MRATLAEWRRAGHGVWRVVLLGDGYDDEFVYLLDGKLSKPFAEALGKKYAAEETGDKPRHFFVKEITKET